MSDTNNNTVIITTRQKLESALRHAQKQKENKNVERFKKLLGQHIVFVVDECHRALSAEGMDEIKKFFPNSTWFGFTGTPIFEENKKQAKGSLPGRLMTNTESSCTPIRSKMRWMTTLFLDFRLSMRIRSSRQH